LGLGKGREPRALLFGNHKNACFTGGGGNRCGATCSVLPDGSSFCYSVRTR
jgi:hypothetical protein